MGREHIPLIGWNLVQSDRGVTVTEELRNRPQEFCIPSRHYGNARGYRVKLLGVMRCSKLASDLKDKPSEYCKHCTTSITSKITRTLVPFHLWSSSLKARYKTIKGCVHASLAHNAKTCLSTCTVPDLSVHCSSFLLSMSVI